MGEPQGGVNVESNKSDIMPPMAQENVIMEDTPLNLLRSIILVVYSQTSILAYSIYA